MRSVVPTKEFVELGEDARRTINFGARKPQEVWAEVLNLDREALETISARMRDLVFSGLGGLAANGLANLLYPFYENGGSYIPESDLFAIEGRALSRPQMALVQRQYTWAHALCSTATFWDELRGQMACMRSLDWPEADALSFATRIYEVPPTQTRSRIVAVGLVGMVGLLTGVRQGAFSVALNYAPGKLSVEADPDPTFKIRQLLENPSVTNYDSALSEVKSWSTSSPCFITLCGTARGDGAVVEFGRAAKGQKAHATKVRLASADGLLVQTNHYDAYPFGDQNGFFDSPSATSSTRRALLEEGLLKACSIPEGLAERILELWKTPPVLNFETTHVALMHPKDCTIRAWRCISPAAGENGGGSA